MLYTVIISCTVDVAATFPETLMTINSVTLSQQHQSKETPHHHQLCCCCCCFPEINFASCSIRIRLALFFPFFFLNELHRVQEEEERKKLTSVHILYTEHVKEGWTTDETTSIRPRARTKSFIFINIFFLSLLHLPVAAWKFLILIIIHKRTDGSHNNRPTLFERRKKLNGGQKSQSDVSLLFLLLTSVQNLYPSSSSSSSTLSSNNIQCSA